MTLEQIKNRQQRINEILYTLVQNTEGVIISILGEQPEQKEENIERPWSGLLGEITVSQDYTEKYIAKLRYYNNLLVDNTYSPVEAVSLTKEYVENNTYPYNNERCK